MTQTFDVPLYITVGVKKPRNIWLNLNNYRNWYRYQNNDYKKIFKETIQPQIDDLSPMKGQVDVSIGIWYPSLHKRDLDGTMSIITKFTLDALVEGGIIEDDNIEFIRSLHASFDGYDKHRPRATITLSSANTKEWSEAFQV